MSASFFIGAIFSERWIIGPRKFNHGLHLEALAELGTSVSDGILAFSGIISAVGSDAADMIVLRDIAEQVR